MNGSSNYNCSMVDPKWTRCHSEVFKPLTSLRAFGKRGDEKSSYMLENSVSMIYKTVVGNDKLNVKIIIFRAISRKDPFKLGYPQRLHARILKFRIRYSPAITEFVMY